MTTRPLPVTFSSFIVSLSGAAMEHMGLAGKTNEPNLPMAQQTMDLIKLLQKKTHGNLDEQEQEVMETMIKELDARWNEVQGP